MFTDAVAFLVDLKEHNEKAWFEAHRDRYDAAIKEPAQRFVEGIAPRLRAISPHFTAIATGRGSSISRMNRDTRFSADKAPYKDWVGFHFSHESGKEAPGFYLHLAPHDCGVGVGVWMLEPPKLKQVREAVAEPASGWGTVRAGLDRDGFGFLGESLVRVPRPWPADHPHAEDLRRKTFAAGRPIDPALPEERLLEVVEAGFRAGLPLVRFLCAALDLPC